MVWLVSLPSAIHAATAAEVAGDGAPSVAEAVALADEMQRLSGEARQLAEALEEGAAQRQALERDLSTTQSQLASSEHRNGELGDQLSTTRTQLAAAEANNQTLDQDLAATRERLATAEARIKELEQALQQAAADRTSLERDLVSARQLLQSEEQRSTGLQAELGRVTKAAADAKGTAEKSIADLTAEVTRLTAAGRVQDKTIEDTKALLAAERTKGEGLAADLAKAQQEAAGLRDELAKQTAAAAAHSAALQEELVKTRNQLVDAASVDFLAVYGRTPVAATTAPEEPDARTAPESRRRRVQENLRMIGHYRGPVDGVLGQGTAAAISEFQSYIGAAPTGILTNEQTSLLDLMRVWLESVQAGNGRAVPNGLLSAALQGHAAAARGDADALCRVGKSIVDGGFGELVTAVGRRWVDLAKGRGSQLCAASG